MFSQLYRPKNTNQLSFNHNLTTKLENIGLQNYIIYGGSGSGKMTRVYCQLAKVFGDSVHNTKLQTYSLTKSVDVSYKNSNYHVEINPSNYGANDKNIICDFIGELAQMANVITNGLKVFVIKDADKLSYKAQAAMRNLVESTHRTARYILTCSNLNKVILPLRSRFILLRNPLPDKAVVTEILKSIAKECGVKTSTRAINIVITTGMRFTDMINLNHIINIFQLSYITGKYIRYETTFTRYADDLIKLIDSKFVPDNVDKIREIIYIIYVGNVDITNILIYLVKHYINTIVNEKYKYQIVELGAKYEVMMRRGNKEPLYLETFILNVINILMNEDLKRVKTIKIKSKKAVVATKKVKSI